MNTDEHRLNPLSFLPLNALIGGGNDSDEKSSVLIRGKKDFEFAVAQPELLNAT